MKREKRTGACGRGMLLLSTLAFRVEFNARFGFEPPVRPYMRK
jgi:hypothetical protein